MILNAISYPFEIFTLVGIVCSHMTKRISAEYAESVTRFLKCDCKTEGYGYPPSPVEVISEEHYKQKLENSRSDRSEFSMTSKSVHVSYNGNIIHTGNFPEADYVCDECGKRYEMKMIVNSNIDEDDLFDVEGLDEDSRVVQSMSVINELPDIRDMWRVMKDGEKILGVAETREKGKQIVQDEYPIEMDLDWSDDDKKSNCIVDKGNSRGYACYTVKYTYK